MTNQITETLNEIIRNGQASAALRFVVQQVRTHNLGEGFTEEEAQRARAFVLHKFKQDMAAAIEHNVSCCNQAVEVEMGEHSLLIRCECCGKRQAIAAENEKADLGDLAEDEIGLVEG